MGHVQWDSVLAADQYMKAEAHREWQQFVRENRGTSATEDIRDMYREHNSNVAYYRLQGRLDRQLAPIKLTASAAKPTELELFITTIKNRFRTSAAKFVTQIETFSARPNDSVATTFARFNEPATIVQEERAMTYEQLARRYLPHILLPLQPCIDDSHFREIRGKVLQESTKSSYYREGDYGESQQS